MSKFSPLEFTENNLVDAIKFIKDGNIVILHTTKRSRIFQNCLTDSYDLEKSKEELKNIRVIYIDCSKIPGLLDDGEWEYYIKKGVECVEDQSFLKTELGLMLIKQESVPNKEYLLL